jgi:CheY-like chemotaxis protein
MPAKRTSELQSEQEIYRKLDALACGEMPAADALVLVRECLRSHGEATEKLYASLRDATWLMLSASAFSDELPAWFDLFRHAAAIATKRSHPKLAERLRTLADLVGQSARFAQLQPFAEVVSRNFVAKIIGKMVGSPAPVSHEYLLSETGLADQNLKRVLAIMMTHGLVARSRTGSEATYRLTELGVAASSHLGFAKSVTKLTNALHDEKLSSLGAPIDLSGTGRLLLVEDDDAVRSILAKQLRARGYEVIESPDGEAALEHIREHAGQISMLISDVILPGIDGFTLWAQAEELTGSIPVTFISGYFTAAQFAEKLPRDRKITFLAKPLDTKTLASHVKHQLEMAA